jgi:signal transduction histidine kinase
MPDTPSLHTRLLGWTAGILGLVIVGSGATVCWVTWRSLVAGIDADLDARAGLLERALQPVGGGGFDLDVPAEFRTSSDELASYYVLFGPDGRVLDRSDPDIEIDWPASPGFRTRDGFRERVLAPAGSVTIVAGETLAPVRREVVTLAGTIASVGLATLALAVLGGRVLIRRALAPLDRISLTARAMTAGDLDARIARDRLDAELDDVARALNDAFTQLGTRIERERRFTSDASHELRTPLATMGAEVEWALARTRSQAEYTEAFSVCQRAIGRMSKVVQSLLTLARADAGQMPLVKTDVALDVLARDAMADVATLAQRRRVALNVRADGVVVHADQDRLTEAVSNLLVNAIQYNREGGRVDLRVTGTRDDVKIVVRDSGIGVSRADLPHIFERFYRADRARASDPGGVGLGLAWVRWVVEAHDGRITAESEIGRGSTFTVTLPRST